MEHTIRVDLKRAILNKMFLFSIIGITLCIVIPSVVMLIEQRAAGDLLSGAHLSTFLEVLSSDIVTFVVPIFAALSYTTSYLDDMRSGYIKFYLSRGKTGQYIRAKLTACGVSGGLPLALGVLLSYGILSIVFGPMELPPKEGMVVQSAAYSVFRHMVLFFFSGAFWALIGFVLASLTQNKYVAYASPFILYYLLIIVYERYLKIYCLYPKEWLTPSSYWVLGDLGVILLLTELISLVCVVFIFYARRKLSYA